MSTIGETSRRPAAAIVIPAWNAWEMTRACLESLRPTMGVGDRVIVVDNGSSDGTAAGLEKFPWVTVVRNAENRGFAVACNQGAAETDHEIVVFLNSDTVLTGHWLDALIRPFALPEIVASGPRSNYVSGPQLVRPVPYRLPDRRAYRDFVRGWQARHRGQATEVPRLVGFCLAVRRSTFDQIGGFDESFAIGSFEDDDLCIRLRQTGGRLVIANESFVHHVGHATFQAAGLDVMEVQRNHEEIFRAKHAMAAEPPAPAVSIVLPLANRCELTLRCLEAIEANTPPELYDVVLVDNGSTDGTAALLAALEGDVTVIRNHRDFGYARAANQGAAAARGGCLVFLTQDAVVDPGWLETLTAAVTAEADTGAVGAHLAYPDSLASGAGALLVGATAFRQVGGFDETGPAGAELSDLRQALAAAGGRLVDTPAAVLPAAS
jgi:GT2 family glycosyltransferase